MRIASITAGAAGTFCGSCLHDNTLAAALTKLGHEAVLLPTYTPIVTDEDDVTTRKIFLGGINAYLDQSPRLARWIPRPMRWLFDRRPMINIATRLSPLPNYDVLGDLALSVLRGVHGNQRQAFRQLLDWLDANFKPEILTLTNVLLSALAPAAKERLKAPILAFLQGDDVFLDALKPEHKRLAIESIRTNAAAIDGFIAPCRDYADYMAGYLGIDRARIAVIPLGINLKGHETAPEATANRPPTIGYFARIAPEKGFHLLVEAFIKLRQMPDAPAAKLRASGFLGPHQRDYFDRAKRKLAEAGLLGDFEYVDSPGLADKVRFLRWIDLFSVPATFREPKGLYVLEALAHGVPVVQPAHGSFPEFIEATGGGRLVPPNDSGALAHVLTELLRDHSARRQHSEAGKTAVHRDFNAEKMARRTAEHYATFLTPPDRAASPTVKA